MSKHPKDGLTQLNYFLYLPMRIQRTALALRQLTAARYCFIIWIPAFTWQCTLNHHILSIMTTSTAYLFSFSSIFTSYLLRLKLWVYQLISWPIGCPSLDRSHSKCLSLSKPLFHINWLPALGGAFHVRLPSLPLALFRTHFLTHSSLSPSLWYAVNKMHHLSRSGQTGST